MRYSEIIKESDAFDLFVDQAFTLYNRLYYNHQPNREYVIATSRRMIRVLQNYKITNDDEEINIMTAIGLFEDLIKRYGGE